MFKWVVFKKKNKPLELFKLQGLDLSLIHI